MNVTEQLAFVKEAVKLGGKATQAMKVRMDIPIVSLSMNYSQQKQIASKHNVEC